MNTSTSEIENLNPPQNPHPEKICSGCGMILEPFWVEPVCGLTGRWMPAPEICGSCDQLAEETRQRRERRRELETLFRGGGIPPKFRDCTFENFQVNQSNAKAWEVSSRFKIDKNKNSLFLCGPCGIGKTHLAAAILNFWKEKANTLYVSCPNFLKSLRDNFTNPSHPNRLHMAQTIDLLVIDDLGAEKNSEWVRETLFILINHRYEHELATIFTTNASLGALEPKLGGRIISRIAQMSRCIRWVDEDWRMRHA